MCVLDWIFPINMNRRKSSIKLNFMYDLNSFTFLKKNATSFETKRFPIMIRHSDTCDNIFFSCTPLVPIMHFLFPPPSHPVPWRSGRPGFSPFWSRRSVSSPATTGLSTICTRASWDQALDLSMLWYVPFRDEWHIHKFVFKKKCLQSRVAAIHRVSCFTHSSAISKICTLERNKGLHTEMLAQVLAPSPTVAPTSFSPLFNGFSHKILQFY